MHESAIGTKRTYRVELHMSAIGGKADMTFCAFDPKRTCPLFQSASLSRYDTLCDDRGANEWGRSVATRSPCADRAA